MMAKPFQQQQHTLPNSSIPDPNIDVQGRFQIQYDMSLQNQNTINSGKGAGGYNAPSSGPPDSLAGGIMGQGFGSQPKQTIS